MHFNFNIINFPYPKSKRPMSYLTPILKSIEEAGGLHTYIKFPRLLRAGYFEFFKEDIDFLLMEGFLQISRSDSFGSLIELSSKGKEVVSRRQLQN